MAITAAELEKIREQLFLVQVGTELALPKNTVDAHGSNDPMVTALDQMMDGLTSAPDMSIPRRWEDVGVGVVNFTKDPKNPTVWLHNGEKIWRVASTGKISVLLSAVQLRDDVRLVKEVTGSTDPAEYDRLFANPDLWRPTSVFGLGVLVRNREITGGSKPKTAARHCPRPSSIFDLTKDPVDFRGPEITTAAAKIAVAKKLGWKASKPTASARIKDHMPADLTWPQVSQYDFSELLWLMGDLSDNVAATACISEIGVAYIKAVQRAYGLYQENTDARLLLAEGYDSNLTTSVHIHGASSNLRPLTDRETNDVIDALRTKGKEGSTEPTDYTDQKSAQAGTATALLAYLIALMQNQLVSSRKTPGRDNGALACETIRQNLSPGPFTQSGQGFPGTRSSIIDAIAGLPGDPGAVPPVPAVPGVAKVTKQLSKIGLLLQGEMGVGLSCEFAHLETENSSGKKLQYGVVVTGIRNNIEHDLATRIHSTLLAL